MTTRYNPGITQDGMAVVNDPGSYPVFTDDNDDVILAALDRIAAKGLTPDDYAFTVESFAVAEVEAHEISRWEDEGGATIIHATPCRLRVLRQESAA